AGVADQIASPAAGRPRGCCKSHILIPHWGRGSLVARLEYENRDLVLACLIKQLGPGLLLRVDELAANQREWSVCDTRHLKGERQLAREPRPHVVKVVRNHIYGVCAGQSRDMRIDQRGDHGIASRRFWIQQKTYDP